MKDNKLISMVEFVLNLKCGLHPLEEYDVFTWHNLTNGYANFLNTPLNIGMFVPAVKVGGEWKVLEEPKHYKKWLNKLNNPYNLSSEKYKIFDEAKDNVIFEGCKVENREGTYFVYIDTMAMPIWASWLDEKTIQDLIKYKPTLTKYGSEVSGLNR